MILSFRSGRKPSPTSILTQYWIHNLPSLNLLGSKLIKDNSFGSSSSQSIGVISSFKLDVTAVFKVHHQFLFVLLNDPFRWEYSKEHGWISPNCILSFCISREKMPIASDLQLRLFSQFNDCCGCLSGSAVPN